MQKHIHDDKNITSQEQLESNKKAQNKAAKDRKKYAECKHRNRFSGLNHT